MIKNTRKEMYTHSLKKTKTLKPTVEKYLGEPSSSLAP